MYLISIYFDQTSNKRIQSLIDEVANITGNTFMTDNHVPPHLTISSFETRNEAQAIEKLEKIAEETAGFALKFVSVGAFFPYVLFAQPVLNEELNQLSEKIYQEMGELSETKISKVYQPFSWIPHMTIGKKLNEEQMKQAFALMQQKFAPISVKVERIGIAKPNPHRDLRVIDLK